MTSTDPSEVTPDDDSRTDRSTAGPAARWATLPEPVDPADMVQSTPASDPPDPTMGRDSDRDWLLRHA